jgi:hypothetical protein
MQWKPWAHTSHLGGDSGEEFARGVEGNALMARWSLLE